MLEAIDISVTTVTRARTAIKSYNYHEHYKGHIVTKFTIITSLMRAMGAMTAMEAMNFTIAINFTTVTKALIGKTTTMPMDKIRMATKAPVA